VTAISTLAAALTGAAVTGLAVWVTVRPDPPRITRLAIPADGAAPFTPGVVNRDLIVTPHGDRVIYRAGDQLMVRALDSVHATALTVGGTPAGLFGSPDGRWIGYSSGGWLRRVATTGGASLAVTELDSSLRGATWNASGTIVFATASRTGLASVAADGGAVTALTTPDAARGEADHLWPEFLPDGRAVLFAIAAPSGGLDAGRIAVADLETRQVTVLPLHGTRPRYISSGHLLFGANGAIQVVAFDAARRRVVGTPSPVLTPGPILPSGDMQLDVTANGTLVYVPRGAAATVGPYSLVWVDRTGQETPMAGVPPRPFAHPQLSRDGLRLMLSEVGQGDIWGLTVASPTLYRITDDAASDMSSTWLADGRVVFASNRSGGYRLYVQSGDGLGEAARLIDVQTTQIAPSATPDGSGIVFIEVTASERGGVRLLTLETGQVTSLVDTRWDERAGTVSPDGRWLAFESNRSDRFEVYVQRFPRADAAGVIPISTGGGAQPRWGPGAKELFYVAPDGAIMAVTVESRGTNWAASRPTRLFSGSYSTRYNQAVWASPDYDTLDGKRFLMLKNEAEALEGSSSTQIIVVQNWVEELKRLVPTQ
jgi:serine/threonine-protein kinase